MSNSSKVPTDLSAMIRDVRRVTYHAPRTTTVELSMPCDVRLLRMMSLEVRSKSTAEWFTLHISLFPEHNGSNTMTGLRLLS
jgi:hypothetical protein